VSTATDERVALEVDLDASVPCNYLEPPDPLCSHPAEWVYRCPGCRYAWLHCTGHRASSDRFEATIPDGLILECMTCETELPIPAPWRAL
jgi:hypothetical protein